MTGVRRVLFRSTLSGGARAQDVYWVVGSSATINSGSAGVFQGNIIAQDSITNTMGGTVNGSLIALTGAVTMSAAANSNSAPVVGTPAANNPNPRPGSILVQLSDNFSRLFGASAGFEGPLSGSPSGSVVQGVPSVIVALGTATPAQWLAAGVPPGVIPALGVAFIPKVSGSIGGSAAIDVCVASQLDHLELVGDPNKSLGPIPVGGSPNVGGLIVLNCMLNNVLSTAPDGTIIALQFYLSQSSVQVDGE